MRAAHPLVLATALATALAACRRTAPDRPPPADPVPPPSSAAPAPPPPAADAGPPPSPPASARPSAGGSRSSCPAKIDAARVRLAHRAAWAKAWGARPPDCKDACVVSETMPADEDGNVNRYHLVIAARGGGFDVIEDVAKGGEPAKCGQNMAWTTLVEGEPLHVRVFYLAAAGMAFDYETDDAGDRVPAGWHCAAEGSEADVTDVFVDHARHERVLRVEQHRSGEDEVEVTVSGTVVRVRGLGCDEERSLGARP